MEIILIDLKTNDKIDLTSSKGHAILQAIRLVD
jgi:hypothetical protein